MQLKQMCKHELRSEITANLMEEIIMNLYLLSAFLTQQCQIC